MALGVKEQLQEAVAAGMMDPSDAEEVEENLGAITLLAQRGIITTRLATHLVGTMAERKAMEWRARHPEWNPGSGVQ
jgi:hypothetical protein